MVLTDELKVLFKDIANKLKGHERRTFMAQVVKLLGQGGQRCAERELNWNRVTMRKGMHELESGIACIDAFSARGRKRAEEQLPNLVNDIKAIADEQSQTDPTFKTTRLYTRISAKEVRKQLIRQKGYTDDELPSEETVRVKLNELGYQLRSVQKCQPQKKIPETDDIFEQLHKLHTEADEDESILRISMDAKATVLIGLLSRGGKTRVVVRALDHDMEPDDKLTPFGIFLPRHNELFLYFTSSCVTSDFIVDCLCDFWSIVKERFSHVQTLLLNQDNGRENHSRRTQFMKRITEFVDQFQVTVHLAHYPPYHSKYNPVERVWGVLENHWNGSLLDTIETALNFAQTMTWNGCHPVVKLVDQIYQTGVRLSQKEMKELEKRFQRLPGLEKWFVLIEPVPS
jgi:transposase